MEADIFRIGETSPRLTTPFQTPRQSIKQRDPIIINGANPWDPVNDCAVVSRFCVLGLGVPHPIHFIRSLGRHGMSVPCPPNCPFCDPKQNDFVRAHIFEPGRLSIHFPMMYISPTGRLFHHKKDVWQITEYFFERLIEDHGAIKPGMCFEAFRDPHRDRAAVERRIPGPLVVNKLPFKINDLPQSFDVVPVIRKAAAKALKCLGWMNDDGSYKPDVLARLTQTELNGHNGHDTNGHDTNGHDTNGHGHDTSEAQAHVGLKAATEAARRHFSSPEGEPHS